MSRFIRIGTLPLAAALGCQHPMPTREDPRPRETAHAPFLQDTTLGRVHYTTAREFDLSNKAARDSLLAIVTRQRALWSAAASKQHQYLLKQECFCPGQRGWILVEVHDGQVARAWTSDGKPTVSGDRDVLTVDELFRSLLSMATSDRMFVNVAFDPQLHFPAYVRTNMARLPDSWSITEIRAFRPLP